MFGTRCGTGDSGLAECKAGSLLPALLLWPPDILFKKADVDFAFVSFRFAFYPGRSKDEERKAPWKEDFRQKGARDAGKIGEVFVGL